MFKRKLSFIGGYFKNKYVITVLVFLVWIMFFDNNDLFTVLKNRKQLQQVEQKRVQKMEDIKTSDQTYIDLATDIKAREKFAREKYLMKRPNEDVFIFVEE
jgi:cell division protein DivIC